MTRNSCKLILVLLACAIPLVAALANARQDNRPSVGLYAQADAARADQHASGQRQAEAYLGSSDVDDQSVKGDAKPAESAPKANVARRGVIGLGANDGPSSSLRSLPGGERGWIVVLASLGLALSLVTAGCLAWLRSRPAGVPMTMLLPQKLPQPPVGSPTPATAVSEKGPSRRAA
jgi:hypothetical protein